MKKVSVAVWDALSSPPARKLEYALFKVVVLAVGAKLGYDFSTWLR